MEFIPPPLEEKDDGISIPLLLLLPLVPLLRGDMNELDAAGVALLFAWYMLPPPSKSASLCCDSAIEFA
jgi:hypothetical protein